MIHFQAVFHREVRDMETKKGYRVKTFTTELKIFQTIKELEALDDQVNRFIMDDRVKKVISVSDTATTDNAGATIGLVRVLTYEG
jgi:predicted GNAT family acetyltransferase